MLMRARPLETAGLLAMTVVLGAMMALLLIAMMAGPETDELIEEDNP